MKIDYNERRFKIVQTLGSGELDPNQIFVYRQEGEMLTCSYTGKGILKGHILGKVDPKDGSLVFTYHQLNDRGELSSGICRSTPTFSESQKIILHEQWEWLSGKKGVGESILEEI
ncbi:n-acetylglutamate synthase [Algoriphagus taiwanensis]|uniref:N-acetylglutamate synthase n=1 Tax=Algoriphagus taiwanensis TaxID=1445656 RepID=A0ABQ6Q757_9BACT|nr:hypothetical protein Ataiwa_37780 [Algoriphagus taiwanensis]